MTLIERLEILALHTKMRLGQHPDYHTLLDAIEELRKRDEPEPEPAPAKPRRTRTKKT